MSNPNPSNDHVLFNPNPSHVYAHVLFTAGDDVALALKYYLASLSERQKHAKRNPEILVVPLNNAGMLFSKSGNHGNYISKRHAHYMVTLLANVMNITW
jgi:hypothetical protein